MTDNHGGSRIGAGRAKGAPTKLMRVPEAIEPFVKRYINNLKILFLEGTDFNVERLNMAIQPEHQIMKVTPEQADIWLQNSIVNRPLDLKRVYELEEAILENKWMFDGSPIRLNESQLLMDGQHRLEAIKRSGRIVKALVVSNIDDEAIKTIDSGRSKSGADMAVMLGFTKEQGQTADTAIKWTCRYRKGGLGQVSVPNSYIYDQIENNKELISSVMYVLQHPRKNRLLKAGIITFLHYMVRQQHEQKANEFVDRFILGDKLELDSPIYHLRQVLLMQDNQTYKMDILEKVATLINAWNSFKLNNKITQPRQIMWRRTRKCVFPEIL